MKVNRMRITEILRRIRLFSANKIKSSEYFSKQPTQLIVELNNSSLRHIIVTKGKTNNEIEGTAISNIYRLDGNPITIPFLSKQTNLTGTMIKNSLYILDYIYLVVEVHRSPAWIEVPLPSSYLYLGNT